MKKFYLATTTNNFEKNALVNNQGLELDFFCIAENLRDDKLADCFEEIHRLMKDGGLAGDDMIIHAPFNELYPAAIDPDARLLVRKRMEQTYDICQSLGIKRMVVHSGYIPKVYFKSWHIDRTAEFWIEFIKDKSPEFEIYIENVLEDEPYMMAEMLEKIRSGGRDIIPYEEAGNKAEQVLSLGNANAMQLSNIKICLDIGHANCVSDVAVREWIRVLAPYIGHFHIHNNDGQFDLHMPFDEGTMNVAELVDYAMKICSPETTFTSEVIDADAATAWFIKQGYL